MKKYPHMSDLPDYYDYILVAYTIRYYTRVLFHIREHLSSRG